VLYARIEVPIPQSCAPGLESCSLDAGMNEVLHNPMLPWAVLPIAILAFEIALSQPLFTLLGLERFPEQRGAASSIQAFLSLLVNATVSGLISPAVSLSPFRFPVAALTSSATGFFFWLAAGHARAAISHELNSEEKITIQ
jgi:DHA1 family bicyclomycin/chloramphenicol resistance-like MFS transporter